MTMDVAGTVIPDGAVVAEDGRIVFVGHRRSMPDLRCDDVVDATGKVVMPGLVNAHTHLCMIFGRTLGVERNLLTWLRVLMPLMAAMDEEAAYFAELLGCVENLKNGNTTIVENIFCPRADGREPERSAFRAMRDSGIRGTVARAFEAVHFDPAFVETAEEQDRRVRGLCDEWHGAENDRLRLSIGPLLPWVVDEVLFRATRRLADELGLQLHMHVSESPEFNRLIAKYFGRSVRQVELLHEVGCLGPDVQAVAVADVSPREVELLAKTRTSVIFDPPTRLYWGTGFPSIKPFLDAGLTCGLATNGPAANCGQDIFESMKYACATAKTATGDPLALTKDRALAMATREGAQAIGWQEIGSLELGKRADVITVDLRQPHLSPLFDLEAALVYSARGSDVRDVAVDGRLLVRDRKVLCVDEAALLEEAAAAARRCLATVQAGAAPRISSSNREATDA